MRLYFSTAMTTAQFPRETGPSLQPSFAFLGVQSEAEGLDGFAETLAEHPRFATAWTQHVCAWANGTACDEGDPEFQRIATVFRERGYQFRTLVAEVMSSPLTTGLAQVTGFSLEGSTLSLKVGTDVRFTYTAEDTSLEGDWDVTGLNNGTGGLESSAGTQALTMNFGKWKRTIIPLIALSAQRKDGLDELRKFLDTEVGHPG
jgi:hypothetical protein